MELIACAFYLYSLVQFVKMLGQILRHDVGAKVYGDYDSSYRSGQRTGAIKTFAKCVLAFFIGGFFMYGSVMFV